MDQQRWLHIQAWAKVLSSECPLLIAGLGIELLYLVSLSNTGISEHSHPFLSGSSV